MWWLRSRFTRQGPYCLIQWLATPNSKHRRLCLSVLKQIAKNPCQEYLKSWECAYDYCFGLDQENRSTEVYHSQTGLCGNALCSCILFSNIPIETLSRLQEKYAAHPIIIKAIKFSQSQHQSIYVGR